MHHVIIMGSRGYTKGYGGWETLVHGMLDNWTDQNTKFYVTEVTNDPSEPEFETVNGVECIRIYTKKTGGTQMLLANALVLCRLKKYIRKFNMEDPILYVLGPRVGTLFLLKRPFFKRHGITVVKNSDGDGLSRGKYGKLQKLYIKYDSRFFNKYVMDHLVSDAKEMERIVLERTGKRRPLEKRVIYYGTNEAPVLPGKMPPHVKEFFDKHGIKEDKYYLIINRFVPENSYEMILSQFIESDTDCDFIVVTNQEKEKAFYERIRQEIPFEKDPRVKFTGTVYDKDILAWLRQKARGYINGHTCGGTNPGLLEALATTDVNLVRDCIFSREGADDTAFYFDEEHPLKDLIAKVDAMSTEERKALGARAKERMRTQFSWEKIDRQYVELFDDIAKSRK